ncbi:MAG TPA: helix-turn-helix domain-containing protein [Rugosimonospora sp.]|nr:helix-turn-helix domain-containing protein [Rugosimonospora sp.]
MVTPRKRLATPEEVAEYYGVPVATLYQWRARGRGPKSSKIGRHVRYRWEDVDKHFDKYLKEGDAA